jgi:hypothetical protein
MFKKLNTTSLLIILALVGGIVIFNKFYQGTKDESTFRPVFVRIDTAAVNSISICPRVEQGKELQLLKKNRHWELHYEQVETDADTGAVKSILAQFAEIKPLSLAGQDKESWVALKVADSSGTKIKITTTDHKSYEMVVGKFTYSPSSRSGMTYIRHANEDAVYAIQGFLAFTVNRPFPSWKSKARAGTGS